MPGQQASGSGDGAQTPAAVPGAVPVDTPSTSDARFNVFKFAGQDFPVWKAQIERVVVAKGYKLALEYKLAQVVASKRAAWQQADTWVQGLLITSVDNQHARPMLQFNNAKDMLDKLIAIHQSKSQASALILQQRFHQLAMNKGEKVADYISRGEYLRNQLQDMEVFTIDEKQLANKIVLGLPRRFINFMSNWTSIDDKQKTIANLLPRLVAEEDLLNSFKNETTVALSSESQRGKGGGGGQQGDSNGKYQSGKNNKKTGRGGRGKGNSGNSKSKGAKPKVDKDECFGCGQKGHWKANCPTKKKPQPDTDAQGHYSSTAVAEAAHSEVVEANVSKRDFLLDSGATDHMSFDRNDFSRYELLEVPVPVRVGNGNVAMAIGIGDVGVISTIGDVTKRVLIKDVLHVPDMERKLVSMSSAAKKGMTGKLLADRIELETNNETELVAMQQGNLYKMMIVPETRALVAESESHLSLWHRRLAHVNNKYLTVMAKQDIVSGLDNLKSETARGEQIGDKIKCVSCVRGKQAHKHFTRSTRSRAKQVGERLHVDLCGPVAESLGNNKYFVLFKDEYSNYRQAYFITTKDQVYECVRLCLAKIEADTKQKVLCLVSDHGSELISKRTQELLLSRGIDHRLLAPFTPAQNGFIERANRTVMEAVRAMLYAHNLPEYLWAEAARAAVYTINRVVNKSNMQKTPFELYFGEQPSLKHMRVFGCLAMVKPQEKKRSGYQKKLEPRSEDHALVGYEARDYTYRLYNPKTKKVVVTREVVSDETRTVFTGDKHTYEELDANLDTSTVEDDDWAPDPLDEIDAEPLAEEEQGDDHDTDQYGTAGETESDEDAPQEQVVPATAVLPAPSMDVPALPAPELSSQAPAQEARAPPRYNLRSRALVAEAYSMVVDEPTSYHQAINCAESAQWRAAMNEEYNSLLKNKTWQLVPLPDGRRPIKCKWVYKLKLRPDGSTERYKARLVACGYSQRYGIDYQETFAPVVRLESVRTLLALVAREDLDIVHFDVKTAFLNGQLDEEIYMAQPLGYEDGKGKVCKLTKCIYGLKQASRVWNACFTSFLRKFELTPLIKDNCILVQDSKKNQRLAIAIYVDDGLACSSSKPLLDAVIAHLKQKFEITVMNVEYFVGLQITRNRKRKTLFVSQQSYIEKVVDKSGLNQAKSFSTPLDKDKKLCKGGAAGGGPQATVRVPYREAIGSLMYAMIGTRPDICHAVGLLARFSEAPKQAHWDAVKHLIQYLNSTKTLGLCYDGNKGGLATYVDSDWASDLDDRKSTSGCLLVFCGAPIIWKSKKQQTVADSTCEAEFVAATLAAKETLWARQLMSELRVRVGVTKLHIDNQGAINTINNRQLHSKVKHIDIKYMFIRDIVDKNAIVPVYIKTSDQLADLLTKALGKASFTKLREEIGMKPQAVAICALAIVSVAAAVEAKPAPNELSDQVATQAGWLNAPPGEQLSIVFEIESPCNDLMYADEFMDDTSGTPTQQVRAMQGYNWYNKYLCETKFKQAKEEAMGLGDCMPHFRDNSAHPSSTPPRLQTRAIPLTRAAGMLRNVGRKLVAYGATNFIKSEFREGINVVREEVKKELVSQLALRTRRFFQSGDERRPLELNDVASNSESANDHGSDLIEANSAMMPRMAWAGFHTQREIIAGMANVKAIRRQCSRRALAVREIGEMLGHQLVANIRANSVRLDDIIVDQAANTIEFVFSNIITPALARLVTQEERVLSALTQARGQESTQDGARGVMVWLTPLGVGIVVVAIIVASVTCIMLKCKGGRALATSEDATRAQSSSSAHAEIELIDRRFIEGEEPLFAQITHARK